MTRHEISEVLGAMKNESKRLVLAMFSVFICLLSVQTLEHALIRNGVVMSFVGYFVVSSIGAVGLLLSAYIIYLVFTKW